MATIQGRNYSTLLHKVDIQVASFVLRPCDHLACVTCFGRAMMNDMKVSVSTCDKVVKHSSDARNRPQRSMWVQGALANGGLHKTESKASLRSKRTRSLLTS